MTRSLAEMSLAELDGLIRGEELLLEMQKREHWDHVTPQMAASYRRIEELEAVKRARTVDGFWGRTPPQVRRP